MSPVFCLFYWLAGASGLIAFIYQDWTVWTFAVGLYILGILNGYKSKTTSTAK